jgi:hypothetical protein
MRLDILELGVKNELFACGEEVRVEFPMGNGRNAIWSGASEECWRSGSKGSPDASLTRYLKLHFHALRRLKVKGWHVRSPGFESDGALDLRAIMFAGQGRGDVTRTSLVDVTILLMRGMMDEELVEIR